MLASLSPPPTCHFTCMLSSCSDSTEKSHKSPLWMYQNLYAHRSPRIFRRWKYENTLHPSIQRVSAENALHLSSLFSLSSHKSTLGTWGLSKKKNKNPGFYWVESGRKITYITAQTDFETLIELFIKVLYRMSTSIAYKMAEHLSGAHRELDRWMASLKTETQAFQNKSTELHCYREKSWVWATGTLRHNASISMLTCH